MTNRVLPIKNGNNFRDLGGYRTSDGHQVQWHRLLRSGNLARLDAADQQVLADLNLKVDVDLRSPTEMTTAPDHYPAGTSYLANPVFASDETRSSKGLAGYGKEAGSDPTVGYQHMLQVYEDMVTFESGQAAFAKLFETALALPADGSLLFHCTAGKDRTGLSAALLLLALGVPLATVRQDYLLSNTTNQAFVDRYLAQIEREGRSATFRTNFQAVATVNGDYLDRALETINDRFGGVATYLRDVLQLGAADLASLRANFLQAGYNGNTKEGE